MMAERIPGALYPPKKVGDCGNCEEPIMQHWEGPAINAFRAHEKHCDPSKALKRRRKANEERLARLKEIDDELDGLIGPTAYEGRMQAEDVRKYGAGIAGDKAARREAYKLSDPVKQERVRKLFEERQRLIGAAK